MTRPRRFLIRMAVFLAAVGIAAALLSAGLLKAFAANPGLNALILGVLIIGIALNIRQVLMLTPEIDWLDGVRRGVSQRQDGAEPRLLAPLATIMGERRDRFSLSAVSMRSLLDGIQSRLDESRDLSRYFVGLMIFLGLLGTFWGLVQSVGSIGDVIRGLNVAPGGDVSGTFDNLKRGLDAPLSGMGTAFSTSFLGLSGSLVLGFLDLQAAQAQNAFYTELEDWLSGQTRVGSGTTASVESGDASVPAYIQALLEQTADSLDNLQRVIARGEESRISANANMRALTDKLSTLTDQMRAEQSLMIRLAESQMEIRPLIQRLAESSGSAIDDATRSHIRNIDVSLSRMVDEASAGRDEVIREVRHEFKLLARTIAAIAEESEPPRV